MSYELSNNALQDMSYGDATFVGEMPAVTIAETQATEEQQLPVDQVDGRDTSVIPAPDERGEAAVVITAPAEFSEEEIGAPDAPDEFAAPLVAPLRRTVYVAASYVPKNIDDLPEGVVDLAKRDLPVAAADVPPENPPTDETVTPAEEPDDAREIAEKIVEIENIPDEAPEDLEARTEALANVVQDAIDTSRALEAAQQEIEALKESAEDLAVRTIVSGDIPTSSETEEQRSGRIDRVADALSDAALAEAEQRDDEDRDPGDLLTEFVDPSDVTRLGFAGGRVDIAEPPAPAVETSTPAETSTVLQPGETRILGEDGWQVTEHVGDYDPTVPNFVNAPVGTALVGRAGESGAGQVFNGNSEGCRIVTVWDRETGSGGLVHIGPEDMDIGTAQIGDVFSTEPVLSGATVEAHVFGDVETSPLGEEIAGGLNTRLESFLRGRGIEDVTVVSGGRGKDVTLDVKTGRVDAKGADGGQIYTNRPPTASSEAATE